MNVTGIEGTESFIYLNFSLQLLSSLIGAGSGAGLSFYFVRSWEKKKSQLEIKQRKIHTIDSLLLELYDIKKEIDKPEYGNLKWHGQQKQFYGMHGEGSTPSFDSSISSGNFILLSSQLQEKLGGVYLKINQVNILDHQITIFKTTTVFATNYVDTVGNEIADQYNAEVLELRKQLPDVISELEKEKKQYE
ncbi:MAG: hypothetical protein FJ360_03285 [Thaumarchaeota archaeon]|nr:hypothetical protein [Nitrososphaerota archaeon]